MTALFDAPDEVFSIPLRDLREAFVPGRAWSEDSPVTDDDIARAIARGDLALESYNGALRQTVDNLDDYNAWTYHVARCAALVVLRDWTPICIEVGCPSFPGGARRPHIYDGNHRYTAACYRDDPSIWVTFSGEVAVFHDLFPNARRVEAPQITWDLSEERMQTSDTIADM